jgi:hypothetical protein
MNYEERKRHVSFCSSYCRTFDWFSGKIRRTYQSALYKLEEYGFKKLFEGKADIESCREGLRILANISIDSGCKAEIAENPEEDRCEIRQCCSGKDLDLCCECPQFPCDLLESNSGVVKFHCIENLEEIKEKGIERWIYRQLSVHRESS